MNQQDAHFLGAFEAGTLHGFPHREHIRMAWLYLRRDGWDVGLTRICEGIQHFALKHGAVDKYHETITRFWAHVVFDAIQAAPEVDDYADFIERNPHLLDKHLIGEYYSDAVIASGQARREWVAPDLRPLGKR